MATDKSYKPKTENLQKTKNEEQYNVLHLHPRKHKSPLASLHRLYRKSKRKS